VRLLAALLRRSRPFATTTSRQREAACRALSRREAATFSFVVLLFGLNSEPVLCVWHWFVPLSRLVFSCSRKLLIVVGAH